MRSCWRAVHTDARQVSAIWFQRLQPASGPSVLGAIQRITAAHNEFTRCDTHLTLRS